MKLLLLVSFQLSVATKRKLCVRSSCRLSMVSPGTANVDRNQPRNE